MLSLAFPRTRSLYPAMSRPLQDLEVARGCFRLEEHVYRDRGAAYSLPLHLDLGIRILSLSSAARCSMLHCSQLIFLYPAMSRPLQDLEVAHGCFRLEEHVYRVRGAAYSLPLHLDLGIRILSLFSAARCSMLHCSQLVFLYPAMSRPLQDLEVAHGCFRLE